MRTKAVSLLAGQRRDQCACNASHAKQPGGGAAQAKIIVQHDRQRRPEGAEGDGQQALGEGCVT